MSKKTGRIEVDAGREALGSSPFAGLGGLAAALPRGPAGPPAAESGAGILLLTVMRTRKGGLPIQLEKRNGRPVTVLSQTSGDLDKALAQLKKRCGAGGCVHEDGLELQGDHRAALEAWLRTAAEFVGYR